MAYLIWVVWDFSPLLLFCYSCRRPPASGCEIKDINTTVQVSYICIVAVCHEKASIIVQVGMYISGTLAMETFQLSFYYSLIIKLDLSKMVFMCFYLLKKTYLYQYFIRMRMRFYRYPFCIAFVLEYSHWMKKWLVWQLTIIYFTSFVSVDRVPVLSKT